MVIDSQNPLRLLPDPEEQPVVPLWPVAAKALGLGRSAVYEAAARGEIPVIRIGRRLASPTAALRRMLQLDGPPGVPTGPADAHPGES